MQLKHDIDPLKYANNNNNINIDNYPNHTQRNHNNHTNNNNNNIEWRTVIFIRHGNSIWNESTDNILSNPYNAAKALTAITKGFKEYATLKWSSEYKHEESIYVDTPLSPKGMKQSYNLSTFLLRHQQLRDEEKLIYLKQHQTLAYPIKDAWRALQQYKLEQSKLQNTNTFPSLCDDALSSLTEAMISIENLMANALPRDPTNSMNDWTNGKMHTNNHINKIDSGLCTALNITSILDILIGKNQHSVIVTSNLRRAISTCVLSLWNRLRQTSEKVYILSCLQEIGINVDTHTDTQEFSVPQVSNFEISSQNLDAKTLNEFYSNRLECIYNYGNKTNHNDFLESQEETDKRLSLFAKWIFMDHNRDAFKNIDNNNDTQTIHKNHITKSDNISKSVSGFITTPIIKNGKNINNKKHNMIHGNHGKNGKYNNNIKTKHIHKPAIIAVGHSAWIRAFFQKYLPKNSDFIGKSNKMSNCGIVAFKFYWNKDSHKYGIATDTTTVVYKGFVGE